jgi:hypothetical protein
VSTDSSQASNEPPGPPPSQGSPSEQSEPSAGARIGADWAAVIVAAVLVLLAVSGFLPAIPFLVK